MPRSPRWCNPAMVGTTSRSWRCPRPRSAPTRSRWDGPSTTLYWSRPLASPASPTRAARPNCCEKRGPPSRPACSSPGRSRSLPPELLPHDVHVWIALLGEPQAVDPEVARTLSRDEVQRSRSFRYERDRRRYVQRRTILRMILSQYLSAPAATIRFTYGPNGKPALDVEDDAGLRFSLASSGEVALYGVTRARRGGVGVDALRPLIDLAGLLARFGAPREASHM